MTSSLDCIFNPQGVAIIGASHDRTKRGYQAVRALKEPNYPGGIYPVNPKGGELLRLPLARLSSTTQERLHKILSPTANVANPIDVGGPVDSDPSLFVPCLQALMDDPLVGGVLQIGLFGGDLTRRRFDLVSPSACDRPASPTLAA
ncbi:MAG: CoA-binding protein [Acidobacteria bacterium]|nr:CoA-binding protein [Acidobacteriota bacterium]